MLRKKEQANQNSEIPHVVMGHSHKRPPPTTLDSRTFKMAGLNVALLKQLMNRNVNLITDITNLAQLSGHQQMRMMEDPTANDNEDETPPPTLEDLDEGHSHEAGASQPRPEEVPLKEFEKELFLEEIRRYRCLSDTNSESYKSRPKKQNTWSKLSKLFNKDGEYPSIGVSLIGPAFLKKAIFFPLQTVSF